MNRDKAREAVEEPQETSGSSKPAAPARLPYEKPTVQRLGSVKDLTFAIRMGPTSDGGSRMSM